MAQQPADRSFGQDELLEKLDQLVNRRRGQVSAEQQSVPVLTNTLPTSPNDDIPTLTDAISGPGHGPGNIVDRSDLENIVAVRIIETLEREIVRLGAEYPAHRPALGVLRSILSRDLLELIRSAWRTVSGSTPDSIDRGASRPIDRK